MTSNAIALSAVATQAMATIDLERSNFKSGYWLRFLDGRWLIYRYERVIGDFPAENAALALDFLWAALQCADVKAPYSYFVRRATKNV